MLYRKKPVIIEAIQYLGDIEVLKMFGAPFEQDFPEDSPKIKTLEGTMTINYGDWIIKGIKGEFYPCKPDIFTLTYESTLE